jgi:hypothetical protein
VGDGLHTVTALPREKEPLVSIEKNMSGFQNWSGCYYEEKSLAVRGNQNSRAY